MSDFKEQSYTWAKRQDITLVFIQPGNPQKNAYIERYNRTVHYDWLTQYLFHSIEEAQDYATQWLRNLQ
jgi:putative transposase